ncbi:entericidin A/B family lipoprotein [Litchfieldella rifensis]|uniref:Entericidin A/B family lipoprotein n=1 Tax=Litchfieldella rifensis TaxID=762643 RepID=A0ABV7LMD0_9GAMM
MKRLASLLLVSLFTLSLLSGCNTIRGMGQDIERGGEAVQDAANDNGSGGNNGGGGY